MNDAGRIQVVFFKTSRGNEPVREWLKSLRKKDRKAIGEDIKTVQFSWPMGMPLVRKIDKDIWEVRSKLGNRTARVLFTIFKNKIILLHGFIKKSKKMPTTDLKTTKSRLIQLKEYEH